MNLSGIRKGRGIRYNGRTMVFVRRNYWWWGMSSGKCGVSEGSSNGDHANEKEDIERESGGKRTRRRRSH